MFKRLAEQLNKNSLQKQNGLASSPIEDSKLAAQKSFLKKLSHRALNLYQKKSDIKKFTEFALSDPNDNTHNDLIKEKGLDEFDMLFDLTNNEDFLKDLGL